MKAFEYVRPTTPEEAVRALAGSDSTAVLSGGTDLLSRMKDYVTSPKRVVYINDIKSLRGVSGDPRSGGITIGAGTRLAEIVTHQGIKTHYPALWQATLEVGTPQIRNMATVGGNLLQRPRCWYYRNGFGLLGGKKEGQDLVRELEGPYTPLPVSPLGIKPDTNLVHEGDNRYHAIFMTDGDALYVSPSSLAVALIALGAKATVQSGEGERTVAVEDLYQVPKTPKDRELTIKPDELLTKITVPEARGKNAAYEVRQKRAHDWPLVMAAVNLTMDGNRVSNARVVLYGVAPIPWRSKAAEQVITGQEVSMDTAAKAGEASVEGAKPLSMNGYKVPLTKTVVKRALLAAVGNRYWEEG
jgi:xanthine dehydrogenase YagS FAD-binding subunit